MLGPLHGLRVISDIRLTLPFEDWSLVRSKGRARRRRRLGHPQRIRYLQVPDPKLYYLADQIAGHAEPIIVGHPETIRLLEQRLAERSGQA